jgi:hypothetical protein
MSMDLLANIAATLLGTDHNAAPGVGGRGLGWGGGEGGGPMSRSTRTRCEEVMITRHNSLVGSNSSIIGTSRKCRRWSGVGLFYSTIDHDYFAENEFIACLNLIGLGEVNTMSKSEWSVVRGVMGTEIGRPRRLSRAFLEGERAKLFEYRASVRQYQRSSPATLEFVVPQMINVGQRVLVVEPRSKTCKTGVVLSIVTSPTLAESASYLVQFDNAEVESAFFTDVELKTIANRPISSITSLPRGSAGVGYQAAASDGNHGSLARANSITKKLSFGIAEKSLRPASRDSNCGSDTNSEDDNERKSFEVKLMSQLSQFSQLSQLSQLSQVPNFSVGDAVDFINEDSQASDISFFKIPTLKLSLLQTKGVIDEAFADSETQAKLIIDRCVDSSSDFAALSDAHPQLYQLVFRCVCCLVVLQSFPTEKLNTDIGSILLAVAIKVCSEEEALVKLNSEQLQVVLGGLTSLCGAVCQIN